MRLPKRQQRPSKYAANDESRGERGGEALIGREEGDCLVRDMTVCVWGDTCSALGKTGSDLPAIISVQALTPDQTCLPLHRGEGARRDEGGVFLLLYGFVPHPSSGSTAAQ